MFGNISHVAIVAAMMELVKKENGIPYEKVPLKPIVYVTGRNNLCPCGSLKKYKKCCRPK